MPHYDILLPQRFVYMYARTTRLLRSTFHILPLLFSRISCALSSSTLDSVTEYGALASIGSVALALALAALLGVRILAIVALVMKSACFALFAFLPMSLPLAMSGHLVLIGSSSALVCSLLPIAGNFRRSRTNVIVSRVLRGLIFS